MLRGVDRLRRDVAERLPLGPGGIVRGAEPIAFDSPTTPRAALVLHGFGDAPDSVLGLAAHLNARGWTVRAPLLPGHGRTLDEFARSGADAWLGAARDAYLALRARHEHVALVGQSMGGALGLILATEATTPPPASLVLLAPYVAMPRAVRTLAALHPVVSLAAPWLRTRSDASILDPEARAASLGYGVAAPRLLRELARVVDRAVAVLPKVAVRTRVVVSSRDNRVPPAAARAAFARLGAAEKDLVWLDGSGHVISVDYERERVYSLVSEWISGAPNGADDTAPSVRR